ncbi:NAD(P)-dependent oxidoreductase [bacterium]|nr:NAD(P)-dependent oxidoreductase [bacterium]
MSSASGFSAKRVVVFGGSGFLGSHVADALTEKGHDVTIFDLVVSPWCRDNQTMIVGNLLDRDAVSRVLDGADIVYHFGGIADISESRLRPTETLELNIMGTVNILNACVQAKVERFVFASTMYVYNDIGSFYGVSKQCAELVIKQYSNEYDLKYNLLRYGSLYGPRAQSWNGVRKYVEAAVKHKSIEYVGTGMERREYIHVSDAARLSVEILAEDYVNMAITVTGHQVLTSLDLLKMIFEICSIPESIKWIEPSSANQDHYGITPYKYKPIAASKMVPKHYIDLGHGILEVIEEVHHYLRDR